MTRLIRCNIATIMWNEGTWRWSNPMKVKKDAQREWCEVGPLSRLVRYWWVQLPSQINIEINAKLFFRSCQTERVLQKGMTNEPFSQFTSDCHSEHACFIRWEGMWHTQRHNVAVMEYHWGAPADFHFFIGKTEPIVVYLPLKSLN